VTQAFLGQKLTCARCTTIPREVDPEAVLPVANLFSRIGFKNGDEPGDTVVFAKATRRSSTTLPDETATAHAAGRRADGAEFDR